MLPELGKQAPAFSALDENGNTISLNDFAGKKHAMPSNHINNCGCSGCQSAAISKAEKEMHVQLSENSRREFLKRSSRLGLGLGIGGGLIAGIAAYFIVDNLEISFLVAFVGIIGMLVDSVLGSWLQAKYINSVGEVSEEKELDNKLIRGYAWCTNNMVNLLSNLLVIAGFIVYKKF